SNPTYVPLIKEFERLIFPARPTPDGMAKLAGLKATMGKIEKFTDLNPVEELNWREGFFREIHYDEKNPVNLKILCALIKSRMGLIAEFIGDLGPPVASA